MTNINCSVDCSHENNGKCTLNHISISSSFTNGSADCAYYEPRQKSSPKSKKTETFN